MDMDIEALLDAHDPDQTGTYDRACVRALLLSTLRRHASSGATPSPARGPMASSSSTGHARPSPAPSAAAAAAVPVPNWSGFFKKSVEERREQVALLRPGSSGGGGGEVAGPTASTSRQQTAVDQILEGGGLSVVAADAMVENCIGVLSMPLGLGLNFVLNGTAVPAVPMATEEPSVIAACSGAAKLIASAGGFETSTTGSVMIGQIQLIGVGGGAAAAGARGGAGGAGRARAADRRGQPPLRLDGGAGRRGDRHRAARRGPPRSGRAGRPRAAGAGCAAGEPKRPVVESPWSRLISTCQRFGHPPRLNHTRAAARRARARRRPRLDGGQPHQHRGGGPVGVGAGTRRPGRGRRR
eukprot:COSAG01_NODE_1413_length_10398_cov_73.448296_9_plen_355_part_00